MTYLGKPYNACLSLNENRSGDIGNEVRAAICIPNVEILYKVYAYTDLVLFTVHLFWVLLVKARVVKWLSKDMASWSVWKLPLCLIGGENHLLLMQRKSHMHEGWLMFRFQTLQILQRFCFSFKEELNPFSHFTSSVLLCILGYSWGWLKTKLSDGTQQNSGLGLTCL